MNNRYARLLLAFSIAIVLQILIVVVYSVTGGAEGDSVLNRFAVLLGGNIMDGGYIQFLTFFMFFWGIFEVRVQLKSIGFERKYMNAEVLPQEEHAVLGPAEVNSVRVKVLQYLDRKQKELDAPYYLLHLIKKAATKFRANHSSDAAFNIVTAQSRINREKSESGQSHIRYIAWAIPSIGFIGTVLGISQALALANTNDIDLITATLGVAFDTTLLALVLSVVLMWMIHDLQEKTDAMHSDFEEFVVDNLINRIDVN